jgi:hypothetical protein
VRALSIADPLVLGAGISALLIAPIGHGGDSQYGAWLYVGVVIAVVTFVLDRLLRIPFSRWAPAMAFVLIPITASAVGVIAGWWAVNNTMGGSV